MLKELIATASAGDAEETWAVTTPATFGPLAMANVPDETEVMLGLLDKVTVPEETATTLVPEIVIGLFGEMATTSAGSADVAAVAAALTAATLAPLAIAIVPELTEVIVGFDDRVTIGL